MHAGYTLIRLTAVSSLLAILLSGCASYVASGQYQPPPPQQDYVPKGYMPPAGQCRIWYNDRPAAQQPPVGSCRTLEKNIPSNARLLRG